MDAPAHDRGLTTGVETMDTEHRLQISLVGALEELVRGDRDPEMVARTVAQLVDFSSVHFLSEELMMRLYAYPQHDAHKLEHGRLTAQVGEIQRRLSGNDHAAALLATGELRTWLESHIRTMDQAFAAWCERHGIAPA